MFDDRQELSDRRVVIADDNRSFRDLLRGMLRSFGVRRVDVFDDGRDVLPFLCQNHVDMVFVDLITPRMDGIRLTREIRHTAEVFNRSMPVVLITGHASRATVTAAVAAGADDVLVKPVSPRIVFGRVKRLLNRISPYVEGADGYFGPNVPERWREMEARLAADTWRMLRSERVRGLVNGPKRPKIITPGMSSLPPLDLPPAPHVHAPVPGLNVPVRKPPQRRSSDGTPAE